MTYTDINKFYNVQLETYTAELQETYKQLHADDETKKFLEWSVKSLISYFKVISSYIAILGQPLEAVRLFFNCFTPFPHPY